MGLGLEWADLVGSTWDIYRLSGLGLELVSHVRVPYGLFMGKVGMV